MYGLDDRTKYYNFINNNLASFFLFNEMALFLYKEVYDFES